MILVNGFYEMVAIEILQTHSSVITCYYSAILTTTPHPSCGQLTKFP